MNGRVAGRGRVAGPGGRTVVMAAAGAAGLVSCLTGSARADDRRFTFVEETNLTAVGRVEYEQWVTWKHANLDDNAANTFDFKHEIEYGASENLQVALDVAEWHFTTGEFKEGPRYDLTAAEVKYRFLDRTKDAVGLAFKVEAGVGPQAAVLENRLIIDKALDRFFLAYNLVVEAQWAGEDYGYHQSNGEIMQSLGGSYEINPRMFAGVETVWEIPLPDWHTGEHEDLFMGPNFSYRGENWAITTTLLGKITGGDDAPHAQVRVLFEVDF